MQKASGNQWIVWGVGLAAYVVAVINRSSFSALGSTAQEHFGADATALSVFVFVQLVVYAACQIPVGIALDRFGAARVIATGTAMMMLGQLLLGSTASMAVAVAARILVGMGDACIFTSVVRLGTAWFTLRQMPVINQLNGLAGQGGQLLAVAPLAALVAGCGWFVGFASLAACGAVVLVLALFLIRDRPGSPAVLGGMLGRHGGASVHQAVVHAPGLVTDVLPVVGPGSSGVVPAIRSLLKRPGVRLAFWMHFSLQFAMHNFVLLWGMPFMTGGLGYSFQAAATVLSVSVVASMTAAALFAPVLSRFAAHRAWIAIAAACTVLLCWAVLLVWPGTTPYAWTLLTGAVTGAVMPVSMSAFDVIRTHAPTRQLGVATGLANMGGYVGALTCVLAVGVLLDVQGAGSPETYSLGTFKAAMAAQLPLWGLGIVMMLLERPKAQREHEKRLARGQARIGEVAGDS